MNFAKWHTMSNLHAIGHGCLIVSSAVGLTTGCGGPEETEKAAVETPSETAPAAAANADDPASLEALGKLTYLEPAADGTIHAFSFLDEDVPSKVTDADLAHLKGLPNLRQLNLVYTKIGDAGLKHVGGLPNLEVLRLHGTGITNEGIKHLAGLPRLKMLLLAECQGVTDGSMDTLAQITTLEVLSIGGTGITDQGIEQLRQALPNCEVETE